MEQYGALSFIHLRRRSSNSRGQKTDLGSKLFIAQADNIS